MPVSVYTKAPREIPYLVDINKQLAQVNNAFLRKLEAEQAEKKEAEASYLKLARVDPIYTASEYWQNQQGKKLQEFEDYIANVYYAHGNKPNLQAKIDMQNHQIALTGWQQKLKANQDEYEKALQQIKADPFSNKYDLDHFNQRIQEWSDPKGTGELAKDLLLPPLIKDLNTYFTNKNYKKAFIEDTTDEKGKLITREIPITDDAKLKDILASDLFKDPSLYRTMTKEFSELPDFEKKKYLDKYSGEYQKKGDNAIKDYMYDKYKDIAFKPYETKERPAPKYKGWGFGSEIKGNIYYDNPSDHLDMYVADNEGEPTDIKSKKAEIWGSYQIPGAIVGAITTNNYIDMKTGLIKQTTPGENILIKYPEIKYMPVYKNGIYKGDSRYDNGQVKGGVEIKPVLITTSEDQTTQGIILTQDLKNKLKSKLSPKLARQIDDIPLNITPKRRPRGSKSFKPPEQEPDNSEKITQTSNDRFSKYKRK